MTISSYRSRDTSVEAIEDQGNRENYPIGRCVLWATRRACKKSKNSSLFPRYCSEEKNTANSASAALNKWVRSKVPRGCFVHSFKHSIRGWLRAVECPHDIADRLGGRTLAGVGEGYGSGHSLDVLHKWLSKAVEK